MGLPERTNGRSFSTLPPSPGRYRYLAIVIAEFHTSLVSVSRYSKDVDGNRCFMQSNERMTWCVFYLMQLACGMMKYYD